MRVQNAYSTLANKWNSILVLVLRNSTPNFHLFEFPFVRERVAAFSNFPFLVFSQLLSENPTGSVPAANHCSCVRCSEQLRRIAANKACCHSFQAHAGNFCRKLKPEQVSGDTAVPLLSAVLTRETESNELQVCFCVSVQQTVGSHLPYLYYLQNSLKGTGHEQCRRLRYFGSG